MDKEIKVSIIVPVYKVEKYLERCVRSLLSQTLKELEIILVDDGSPDDCPNLCDEYAKKYECVRVVHKNNGGLSSARNAGMVVAKGQYIGFVDSDDDVDANMYQKLFDVAERWKVDFVMSDYMRIRRDGKFDLETKCLQEGVYDKERIKKEIFPQLIMGENLEYGPLLSVWQCLYRRDFLEKNNLYFDEEVRWSEDNIFSAFVGYYANSFCYIKGEGLYHYYDNPGTITTSYRSGAWEVYCTMNDHLHQFFDKTVDYDFQRQLKLHLIFYACNCLGQIKKCNKTQKEKMQIRADIMNTNSLKLVFKEFKFPKWSWKLKIQIMFIKYRMKYLYQLLIG